MNWKPIETCPNKGEFRVLGGWFDSAYSQIHGMKHDNDLGTLVVYQKQTNQDVDPPYRILNDRSVGIDKPTHWAEQGE